MASPVPTAVDARIRAYLEEAGLQASGPIVEHLAGDASDRRYVRVRLPAGASLMLSVHSGPIVLAALPFANVAALLREVPLPIPEILGHSDALGIVALQDLGDVTLQTALAAAGSVERRGWYREAMGLIDRLQRRGAALASDRYLPYTLAFDAEKLTWELTFFVQHFVEASRSARIEAAAREALSEEWAAISQELASEPRVLCHRDYHSRNLMLHDGRLYVIDFQDARLGPDTYDLVSLLRDAYVDVTPAELDEHLDWFLKTTGRRDAGEFRRRFNVMTVQRTLKALGTFGYQATTHANPRYLQYVPRTIGYARAAMAADPRFARLREILAGPLPELNG
jgi:hypothetical protein